MLLALAAGIVLALVLVRAARRRPPDVARRIYAVGLVVAALIYAVLAARGGASARWLALEGLGVLLYGGAAWVGLRGQPTILALGWAAHVAWDVLLHLGGSGAAYTPDWYPWLCVSFDLVIAGAALTSRARAARELSTSYQ